jgi:hypothetical protein
MHLTVESLLMPLVIKKIVSVYTKNNYSQSSANKKNYGKFVKESAEKII